MFNALVRGFRDIPRRGQHNVVKILCLALGLGLSAVVIAEIIIRAISQGYVS